MKARTFVLAGALLAAIAVPAVAQDGGTRVAVAYVDKSVDGPIATSVARLDQNHGGSTVAVEAWTLFTEEGWGDGYDCVVAVGRNGDKVASGIGWSRNGVEVHSAQGGDRYETSVLAADAVADCRE